tara:strand:- start:51385 stop:51576 length:192 start_codon:yes stop_codon:yes gene_type:complete
MKALKGKIAKKFLSNKNDKKILKDFLISEQDEAVVTSSNGKRYIISNHPLSKNEIENLFNGEK